MTNTIIKIKGMHCQGCAALIRMELEDKGLKDKLIDVRLSKEAMMGEVELQGLSLEQLTMVKRTIDELEGYQALS